MAVTRRKNKLSRLVEKAQHGGPQFVTKHGKESVVVLSVEEFQKMENQCQPLTP